MQEQCGAIAQLGERLNGIQEVVGSIPIGSTSSYQNLQKIIDRILQLVILCLCTSLAYYEA